MVTGACDAGWRLCMLAIAIMSCVIRLWFPRHERGMHPCMGARSLQGSALLVLSRPCTENRSVACPRTCG